MSNNLQENSGLEQVFGQIVQRGKMEKIVPRLQDIHRHEQNARPENRLNLGELQPDDEVTLQFYPSKKDAEPRPMRLVVREVREKGITALASGGPEDWVNQEVRLGCSTITPEGSMAKTGVIEAGLCPEFHFHDPELYTKNYQLLRDIYTQEHGVSMHGIKFDDDYFDNYRTDLHLPTTQERIDWLAQNGNLGHRFIRTEPVADFKVEKPQPITLPPSKG